MAKQIGENCIEGCFDNIVFYKMGENFYARRKSGLDGRRVKRDPAFKATMKWAELLAKASKIASMIYKTMTTEEKKKEAYRTLTGRVMQLLKKNKTSEEIMQHLSTKEKTPVTVIAKNKILQHRILFANEILQEIFCDGWTEDIFNVRKFSKSSLYHKLEC